VLCTKQSCRKWVDWTLLLWQLLCWTVHSSLGRYARTALVSATSGQWCRPRQLLAHYNHVTITLPVCQKVIHLLLCAAFCHYIKQYWCFCNTLTCVKLHVPIYRGPCGQVRLCWASHTTLLICFLLSPSLTSISLNIKTLMTSAGRRTTRRFLIESKISLRCISFTLAHWAGESSTGWG